jgi:hypothetical protein
MSFFSRPNYTSEITQFLEKYKKEHPGLEERQREGRALLWDKRIDRDQTKADLESRIPQQGYVYQSGGTLKPALKAPAKDNDAL